MWHQERMLGGCPWRQAVLPVLLQHAAAANPALPALGVQQVLHNMWYNCIQQELYNKCCTINTVQ
jgi:hypothetical protein